MSIGSGLAGSVGVAEETTYGTAATPTLFLPPSGAVALKKTKNTVQGGGISAGRMVRDGGRRVVVSESAGGTVPFEVATKKMGLLLQHIFGSSATPVQQGATAAYLQTHALGDNFGKSLTIQSGVPDRTGTVRPYTFLGSKVTQAEFSCAAGELLTVNLTLDSQQVVETEALASPSYSTGVKPFHFRQLSVKLGSYGTETAISGVKGVSLTLERPQDTEAFYAGANGLKDQPVMNDWVAISGSLDMDLVNKTQVADLFRDDTSTSMVIEFLGATIASTYKETFRLRVPMVFFNGDTPSVDGPGIVSGSNAFEAQYDLSHAPITCEYQSVDTTI